MGYMKVIWAVLGVYLLVQLIASVMPLLFANSLLGSNLTLYPNSFYNSSVWGTFGSAVLPILFPILLSVGIILLILAAVWVLYGKHAGGKGKAAYGL